MKCKKCGRQNRMGVSFCEECGASLSASVSSSQICSQCHYENRAGVKYCENCGSLIRPSSVLSSLTCAQCGFANRPGVRFCESCGQSLSAVKARGSKFLKTVLASAVAFVVCLTLIFVGFGLNKRTSPVFTGGNRQVTFPDFGDFSKLDSAQAKQIGDAVVAKLYPELIGANAEVTETFVNGERILNVGYRTTIQAEAGSFDRIVFIAINTTNQTISIIESN